MEMAALVRTLGALAVVLGLLGAALWVVRRFDLALPGRMTPASRRKRLELVERLSIDAKRSVALIRRDDTEHLIMIGPEGHGTIEAGIAKTTQGNPVPTSDRPVPVGFGGWLERAEAGTAPRMRRMPRPRSTGVAERAARRVAGGG